MPKMLSRPESVHLALLPNSNDITGEIRDREQALQVRSDWDYLFTVRELALRQLEELRNDKTIKANLEARVTITASGDDYKRLAQYADKLPGFFVVSQVEVKRVAKPGDSAIAFEVGKAEGVKCERCWNFSTHVGEDAKFPTVCERCSANLGDHSGRAGREHKRIMSRTALRIFYLVVSAVVIVLDRLTKVFVARHVELELRQRASDSELLLHYSRREYRRGVQSVCRVAATRARPAAGRLLHGRDVRGLLPAMEVGREVHLERYGSRFDSRRSDRQSLRPALVRTRHRLPALLHRPAHVARLQPRRQRHCLRRYAAND